VCRILAKTADGVAATPISLRMPWKLLAESRVRDIHMIGRRGPAQAKFTHPELRELGELADCDPIIDARGSRTQSGKARAELGGPAPTVPPSRL